MLSLRHILGLAALGVAFSYILLNTSCARFSKQSREPTSQSGCLGSVFLKQGQLVQPQSRNLVTVEHPYGSLVLKEAILSPDFQQVAILAEIEKSVPKVLFYECGTSKWHLGFQDTSGVRLSKLTWSPDGNWVAFLKQEVHPLREKGRDLHRFGESVMAINWPSFEIRTHLTLKSSVRTGLGLVSDITSHHLGLIRSFQFHPTDRFMVIQTVPERHPDVHVFRMGDLAKARPEFPGDFPPWFESPTRHKTQLFLTDTGGIRLAQEEEGRWKYSFAAIGSNDFRLLKMPEILTGKGVTPLFVRDNVLYLKVQTTRRTYLYSVVTGSEVSVKSIFMYEGHDSQVGDFDIFLNRLVYSCRSKTSGLNHVCLGQISDGPVHNAPVFVSDKNESIYPVLTYWPR